MDPFSLIGGAVGGLFNFLGTQSTNSANQQMMQQQQAYQTQMSNTAYQRASADMKAAGLNPMMMFGSGGPASTPSAPASAPRTSPLASIGSSISGALNNAVTAKTVDKLTEEIAKIKADKGLVEAETRTESERPGLVSAQARTEQHRPGLVGAETRSAEGSARLKEIGVDVGLSDAAKARMEKELVDNPVTRKVLQGGLLGKSASDIARPIVDVVGGVVNSALRKRGLDFLRDRMEKYYGR